ncbi:class I SAM-dependent methyltransferase [Solemya velesiana gill symbiont]|uniref:SAM-dependent methyltransferase n=1 Tax=Solemya velesiana gill symbiont TaxID=1918948 RepID=A0A1T2KWT1_9GAMM|nr:SAM-dependent methyltransferase [Solemya velesiana gill symbiont]OOZ37206.1 SAM-dependent methyltransferase [Solemya velesiana gill symbiont]
MSDHLTRPGSLPEPDEDARIQSERLITLIRSEIEASGGKIPFDRYMELALYAPWVGYYTGGARKFGEAGDFITAPEVSPLFGRCLARQCEQVFKRLGGGELLEIGAGSGALAADLLEELARLDALPERYLILDVSPELRQRQCETLESRVPGLVSRVAWIEDLPDAGFRGVVIANELLDAMPVQRFRLEQGTVFEQFVGLAGEGFADSWGPTESPGIESAVAALCERLGQDREDYESEINQRAVSWLQALGERLAEGLVLLIDYGYNHAEYYHPQRNRGTLMCHYRHRAHPDPFVYPGLQDITAYVDFSAIAGSAAEAGFTVSGYTSQAFFLMSCGLDQLVAQSDPNDVRNHMELVQGVKRLTLPTEMGERFKMLGLTKAFNESLLGFQMRDQRERL